MCIIQFVVQPSAAQSLQKCSVVFKAVIRDAAPNYLRLLLSFRESEDRNMETMAATTAFIMQHITFSRNCCPNKTLSWNRCVCNKVGCFPLLISLRKPAIAAGTKCDDGWREIS